MRNRFNLAEMQKRLAKKGELITEGMMLTKAESEMGNLLLDAGLKAIPQFIIDGRSFDFRIAEYPILIEVDGGIHNTPKKRLNDYRKDRYVMRRGYRVFRYTNFEVGSDKNFLIVKELKNAMEYIEKCPRETLVIYESFFDRLKGIWKKVFKR